MWCELLGTAQILSLRAQLYNGALNYGSNFHNHNTVQMNPVFQGHPFSLYNNQGISFIIHSSDCDILELIYMRLLYTTVFLYQNSIIGQLN